MTNTGQLGVWSAVSYLFGSVIGSGIFVSPTVILENVKSPGLTLAIWLICGLICLLGTVVYAELVSTMPEFGADYAYMNNMKWKAPAFSFMFVSVFLSYPGSIAVQSRTLGTYLLQAIRPWLNISGRLQFWMEPTVGTVVVVILMIFNCRPLSQYASKLQLVCILCTLATLLAVTVVGTVYTVQHADTSLHNLDDPFNNTDWSLVSVINGIYGGLWAFSGWADIAIIAEEVANPKRTIPIASFFGMSGITITYIMVNVVYFLALGKDEMLKTGAVAENLMQKVIGKQGALAFPFLLSIVLISNINSTVLAGSRYTFAAARERQLPGLFSVVNRNSKIPVAAVLLMCILATVLSFTDKVESIMLYVIFITWAPRLFTMAAVFMIRIRKLPIGRQATIKVPLVLQGIFFIIVCALVIIPIIFTPLQQIIGMVITLLGLAIYLLLLKWEFQWHKPLILFNAYTTSIAEVWLNGVSDTQLIEEVDSEHTQQSILPEHANPAYGSIEQVYRL